MAGNDSTLTRSWPWGYKYLAGLELIHTILGEGRWHSLLEIGCGDGFVLGSIKRRFADRHCVGVDYSARAIAFAKAFHPGMDFRCIDFTRESIPEAFDWVVLTEVLEHIDPKDAESFLRCLAGTLKRDGKLILTVPHLNQPLLEKHFRHFDEASLRNVLQKSFAIQRVIHFDRHTRALGWMQKLFVNQLFQITSPGLQRWLLGHYRSNHFAASPNTAWRIAVICTPQP